MFLILFSSFYEDDFIRNVPSFLWKNPYFIGDVHSERRKEGGWKRRVCKVLRIKKKKKDGGQSGSEWIRCGCDGRSDDYASV
jgi:hypothetical protein